MNVAAAHGPAARSPSPEASRPTAAGAWHPVSLHGRVLVVDPDAAVRDGIAGLLQEHGFAVEPSEGGAALLERLARPWERPTDVVLLDATVPAELHALAALRADPRWSDVPVLVLTTARDEELLEQALVLGAADVLRKPFRARELVARVEAQARAGAELRAARGAVGRLEQELARVRAEAEGSRQLVDILHEITGDLPPDDVYPMLVRRVARALGANSCSVMLARDGEFAVEVAASMDQPGQRGRVLPAHLVPEVREALRTGRPVLVEDAATHPLYAGGRAAWGLYGSDTTLRSAVAIPFTVERPQRGVLLLRRTADQAALTADDASLAEQVVEAAVSVLQRARVMEAALADNARLEELATTDPLTRVLNRRALLDRLAGEMERALRYAGTMAVLLLDLDYFKQVNDTYGHLAGDAVLRDLAVVLQSVARSSDVVGRFGGEEFFVVLPETDLVGAHAFAERLRERLAAHPFRPWHDERTLQLTASVGVAAFPGSVVETMDELIGRADAALYRAKAEGRNRVGS